MKGSNVGILIRHEKNQSSPQRLYLAVQLKQQTSDCKVHVILRSRQLYVGNICNRQTHRQCHQGHHEFQAARPPKRRRTRQALWSEAFRRRPVYDEYRLKKTFIEGLKQSLRQSDRNYLA